MQEKRSTAGCLGLANNLHQSQPNLFTSLTPNLNPVPTPADFAPPLPKAHLLVAGSACPSGSGLLHLNRHSAEHASGPMPSLPSETKKGEEIDHAHCSMREWDGFRRGILGFVAFCSGKLATAAGQDMCRKHDGLR